MHDAAAEADGRQLEPELARPPAPNSAYNPIDVVPGLAAFVASLLGPAAGSAVASIESPTADHLIHFALARKLELIHVTVLSIKAKADHAHQVATSAINVASTAANTSRTYAQETVVPPNPSLALPTLKP